MDNKIEGTLQTFRAEKGDFEKKESGWKRLLIHNTSQHLTQEIKIDHPAKAHGKTGKDRYYYKQKSKK